MLRREPQRVRQFRRRFCAPFQYNWRYTDDPDLMPTDFTDDDAVWITAHVAKVVTALQPAFERHAGRFPDHPRLVTRLESAAKTVVEQRRRCLSPIDEAHNELCVALGILESDPGVTTLQYEPPLSGTKKSIDFVATYADAPPFYVDVKTIAPKRVDRWEKFETAEREGYFPESVSYTLYQQWLGGELFHNAFAARSRMLEHTLELEAKVAAAGVGSPPDRVLLLLCSNGFHWHEDELEDFVAFYLVGRHRADDPFGKMEEKTLRARPLPSTRSVRRFGYLARSSEAVLPQRMTWNVTPPPAPFGYRAPAV